MSLQQLSKLVDYLPEEDLKQLLSNASSMSPSDAAELFKGFLGETPASLEFISSFNSRRQNASSNSAPVQAQANISQGIPAQSSDVPPRNNRTNGGGKKKANIHTPAPRQIDNAFAGAGTAYRKDDEGSSSTAGPSRGQQSYTRAASNLVLRTEMPKKTQTPPPRLPPSAQGRLISDPKPAKNHSAPSTRSSSPRGNGRNTQKVHLTGGTPMSSASKALEELDTLIKTLEAGSSTTDNASRACNCIATRHPLLAAAPNCLNCGKVICVKEGFGPCTFCGHEILAREDRDSLVRSLKEDRAEEKKAIDRALHKKVDSTPRNPYTSRAEAVPQGPTPAEIAAAASITAEPELTPAQKAQMHRDKLLNFQAQNAARTTVHDEAADFATPELGVSQWVGPMERARLVKQQQKVLREQEWNARPEWEKKREMVSLDVVNGKVVRKFKTVTQAYTPSDEPETPPEMEEWYPVDIKDERVAGGTFSNNPLLGGLIRPRYTPADDRHIERKTMWRRVQDDYEDNEAVILDGGVYGGRTGGSTADPDHREGADERANS